MSAPQEHPAAPSLELHATGGGSATPVTPLTPQQVFDNALHGVIAQGAFSKLDDAAQTCAYRGTGGMKCGIGHSIPDAIYSLEFDRPLHTSILFDCGTEKFGLTYTEPGDAS
jgi:hypothetical protein